MTFSAVASRASALAGFTFLAAMQYWIWCDMSRDMSHDMSRDVSRAGGQLLDPLLPCTLAAAAAAAVVVSMTAIAAVAGAVRRRWHERRLRRALAAARAAEARQPARTLPVVVAAHPHAPARVIWRPDDGIFDVADVEGVCQMAFDHDAAFVIVEMKPAAEQAARILIRDLWPRLCAEQGDDRACPMVLPMACGGVITRPLLIRDNDPPPLVIPGRAAAR